MDAIANPPRVFISYARTDGEALARDLRLRLEGAGIALWQDRANLEGGHDWWLQITAALDRVDFLVWLMTPAAMRSTVVRKEWRYARQQGVTVYPVKGAATLDFGALPRWMRDLHFYDLEHEWTKFVGDLEGRPTHRRVPVMVDDLPEGFVPRPDELESLLRVLVNAEREEPIPARVAVCGAGGFGKTTLVVALCHDERIQEAFDDGIVWVRLGEHPGELIGRVEDLIETLVGARPGFSNLEAASARLGEVLADRDVLIVIDDAWNAAHLAPFLVGGARCARLITTRNLDVLPPATTIINAGAMRPKEASALVASGLRVESDLQFQALATRLGGWPLVLRLVNGVLRERVDRHRQPLAATLDFVTHALERRGLKAFDARNAEARNQAIEKTMAVSLELLTPEEQERYRELAIFPAGPVPVCAVERLWAETGGLDRFGTEELCLHLARLSLLVRYDLELDVIELHDALRHYLVAELGMAITATNDALLRAYEKLAPGGWSSGPDDGYFFQRLGYHLVGAGKSAALSLLLTGAPDWMRAQSAATRGDAAYQGDVLRAIDLVPDPTSAAAVSMLCELYTGLQVVGERARLYDDEALRVLVCLGREAEALSCARLRGDAAQCALGLVAIATAHESPERVNASLLDEAERIARNVVDVEPRTRLFDALSSAWVMARGLVNARRLARDIHDPASRARAVARVGLALARASQDAQPTLADALELAREVAEPDGRTEALADVAATMLEAGDLALARHAALELHGSAQSVHVFQPLLIRLASEDESAFAYTMPDALAAIAALPHAEDQAAAYTSLGRALGNAGRTADAGRVLHAATSAAHAIATTDYYEAMGRIAAVAMIMVPQDAFFIQAAEALNQVGCAFAQAGLASDAEGVFAEARQELASVPDAAQRDAALAKIGEHASTVAETSAVAAEPEALSLARSGKLAEAAARLDESLRERERSGAARDGALRTLVSSFADLGDASAAMALSEAIGNPSERARACCSRVEAAARLDDSSAADRAFDQLLSAASCETSYAHRALLAELVLALYDAGLRVMAERALASVIERADEGTDLTLDDLAGALMENSLVEQAEHVVSLMRDPLWKEPATARLESRPRRPRKRGRRMEHALALARRGELEAARAAANAVDFDWDRVRVFAMLAPSFAKAGRELDAMELLQEGFTRLPTSFLDVKFRIELLGLLIDAACEAVLIEPALRAAEELQQHERVDDPDKWDPAGQVMRSEYAENARQAKTSRQRALGALGAALIEALRIDDVERVASALGDPALAAAMRREGALRLIQKGHVTQALAALGRQSLDQWIEAIAGWAPALEKIQPGLNRAVLANVVRIIGWVRADWAPIEPLLQQSSTAAS